VAHDADAHVLQVFRRRRRGRRCRAPHAHALVALAGATSRRAASPARGGTFHRFAGAPPPAGRPAETRSASIPPWRRKSPLYPRDTTL
jgi:hypothetical protein